MAELPRGGSRRRSIAGLRREGPGAAIPIALGALVPDAPMFFFYLVEKGVRGVPEAVIWSSRYFDPAWQDLFDLFHSLPLMAVALAITLATRQRSWTLLFASMVLHVMFDLPLHHDDAHRHFYPLSDFRFASPVSYWDSAHYGWLAVPLEAAGGLFGCLLLWRRQPGRAARLGVAGLGVLYVAYVAFALFMWV